MLSIGEKSKATKDCAYITIKKRLCVRRAYSLFYIYIEIQPNAFAMELIKIITAKIGQRYWIMM